MEFSHLLALRCCGDMTGSGVVIIDFTSHVHGLQHACRIRYFIYVSIAMLLNAIGLFQTSIKVVVQNLALLA